MNTAFMSTAEHINHIDLHGFTVIPQVFDADQVAKALDLCKQVYAETKDKTTKNVPFLNKDQPNIYNLHNKDPYFLFLLLHSEVLEKILIHFLNDKWYKQIPQDQPNYIMRSALGRSSNLVLPWHIDSFIPYVGPEAISMQVAIILEDQYEHNGCTRVVPGSHQSGEYAPKDIPDNAYTLLNPKAGDIVVFDGRLWHGTTENKSGGTRWAVLAAFCRWWVKQNFDVTGNYPKEWLESLTPKQKSILGYNSIPPYDELEAIDMKKGYE